MKISNASKKVLASALSLAMVAAFSPATAAFATPSHDENESWSTEIGHTMDHGTVTKAATCNEAGYVTYKCIEDACDYSYVQVIPATGKHSWAVDASDKVDGDDGVVDGVSWTYDSTDSNMQAVAHFKCANGKETKDITITGVGENVSSNGEFGIITKEVTKDATFDETGVTTYKAKATLDGVTVESTYVKATSLRTFSTAKVEATDDYGTVKLDVYDSDSKLAASVKGDVTTKVTTKGTCNVEEVTEYKAKFAAIPGVSSDAVAKAISGKSIAPGDTTLSYNADNSGSIVANPDGTVEVTFSVTGKKNSAVHESTIQEASIAYMGETVASNATTKAQLAAGTVSTAATDWTVTYGDCTTDDTFKGKTNANPTSVTKEQVGDVWVYTITVDGVKDPYVLYAGTHTASYELVPSWTLKADGTVASVSVSAVDKTAKKLLALNAYDVDGTAYTNDEATKSVESSCTDKSAVTAPTCEAAGSYKHTVTVAKDNAVAAGVKATEDWTDTVSGTIAQKPKGADHEYVVDDTTINWSAGHAAAYMKVHCTGDGNIEVTKLSSTDITSKVVAGTSADNRTFGATEETKAGTKYTATFKTDFSLNVADNSKIKRNTDGTYSAADFVGQASAAFNGALNSVTNLPTADEATKAVNWTVTVNGKAYTPTKVEADADHSKAAKSSASCAKTDAYKVTLADGSTYVFAFTGKAVSHDFQLVDYSIDNKAYANMKCSVCGQTKTVTGSTFNNNISVITFDDGTKVNVYQYATDVAQDKWGAPTFKFSTKVKDGVIKVKATATFTSEDGKKVVSADCDVELVDAATNTYKATVVSTEVPTGYTGDASTLTATQVVDLHEGHAVNLSSIVKASATAEGYVEYFCNNDNMTYRVVIAKDNMKLAKTTKAFKYKKVAKGAKKVAIKVANAKGKVTYKVAKKVKKAGVSVSAKGVVKVKKGTAKGTYKVTVTSKATANYKANSKTFKVKVK